MGCSASGVHSPVVPLEPSSTSSAVPKRLLEDYAVHEQLGEGAFGVVYRCMHRTSGLEAAVKMVDKVETPVESIEREVQMLKDLSHPNIVRFHAVYHEKCFICIVMDMYSGGDLIEGMQKHLRETGKIDGRKILHVIRQMLSPVEYLNAKNIVHRDVKGDNYLLDRSDIRDAKCRVVLTDFGTARALMKGERLHEPCGTRLFWAPEFYDRNYGLKVDIWAVGICVFGLLSGNFPFQDETEVRKKTPKLKNVGSVAEDFIKSMLRKSEKSRISAASALDHDYIRTRKEKEVVQETLDRGSSTSSLDQKACTGPAVRAESVHLGVQSRRKELLERMNERHRGKKASLQDLPIQMRWFTIVDKNIPGLIYKFEWWDQKSCEEANLLKYGTLCKKEEADEEDGRSPLVVGQMLREHGVDISLFGKGEAKSLEQLAAEVRSGQARLMLDAGDYKKLVRVVDVVLLRLFWQKESKVGVYLIEMGEKYPDGRRRDIARMPGTKRRPWESAPEAAKRMLEDLLEMGDLSVAFDLEEKEVFEEEFESPSFPGVMTVYRKEIVPCYVQETNPKILQRYGLPEGKPWTAEDPRKNVKFLQWATKSDAELVGVSLSANSAQDVSGLVHAPIGMGEEALKDFLQQSLIDTSKFGQGDHKTIREFSQETVRGDSSVILSKTNEVLRLVDLVLLKIKHPITGEILVQREQISPNGNKLTLKRLPGGKRRPDESQFLTARRILQQMLKIDEDQVSFQVDGVESYEEETNDLDYPDIRTTYRTHVLPVQLVSNRKPVRTSHARH